MAPPQQPSGGRASDRGRSGTCPHLPRPRSLPYSLPTRARRAACLPCRRLDLLLAVSEHEELCFHPSQALLPSRAAGKEMCFPIEVSCRLPSHPTAESGLEPRISVSVPAPPDGSPPAAIGKLLSSVSQALFSKNLEGDSLTRGGGVGGGCSLRWRRVVPCGR